MKTSKRLQFGDFAPQFRNPKTAQIVVVPVPYDGTSTYMKGADKGPEAILKASYNLEFYDVASNSEVFRKGIFTDTPIRCAKRPEAVVSQVQSRIAGHLQKGKFPVMLGGEHSITAGAVEALAGPVDDLSVLQLDAHSDLRDSYEGSKYNHACVMARVREICPIVQVGIRSTDISEQANLDKSRVFFAKDICDGQPRSWIDKAVSKLSRNVYITIDLDAFDPSLLPATGTPEPGGLFWYDVMALLTKVCAKKNVVGFDVVELCPRKHLWGSDFIAAKLVYSLLTLRFAK